MDVPRNKQTPPLQDSKEKPSPHSTHLVILFLLDFSEYLNATGSVEKNKWHERISKKHRNRQQNQTALLRECSPN